MAFNGRIAALSRVLKHSKNPEFEIFKFLRSIRPSELAKTYQDLERQIPEQLLYGATFPKNHASLFYWPRLFQGQLPKELQLLVYELNRHSDQITAFTKIESAFSRAILARQFELANEILFEGQKHLGESLWLLESRLSLLDLWKGTDENKAYANKILDDDAVSQWVKILVYLFSLKAEKNTTTDRFKSTLTGQFPLEHHEQYSFVHYVNFHTNFHSTWWLLDLNTVIGFERGGTIIDRYLTFVRVCQIAIAKGSAEKITTVKGAVEKLVEKIQDPRLYNLHLALSGRVDPKKRDVLAKSYLSLIDDYTSGRYEDVCNSNLNGLEDRDVVSALDVMVRAAARASDTRVANPSFALVSEQYRSLLLKHTGDGAEFESLAKLVQMFSKSDWALSLANSLSRETSKQEAPHDEIQALADLNASSSNPKIFARYLKNAVDIPNPISNSVTYHYLRGTFATVGLSDSSTTLTLVPQSRRLKYSARESIKHGDKSTARQQLEELFIIGDELDKQEAAKALIKLLVDMGEMNAGAKFTAEVLIAHPSWHAKIPLLVLLEAVEAGPRKLRRTLNAEIYLSICLGLYSSIYGPDRDESKTISAEEFLTEKGVNTPSELRDLGNIAAKDALIYFLMSVCKIETLDSHIAYESERDVQDERIRILLWLSELDEENNSLYRAEIAAIAQRQLLLRGVQAVDKSRIYVDVDGVKASAAKDLADLYSRFQNLPDTGGRNVNELVLKITETLSSKTGLVQFVVPKNERLAALRDFVTAIRDRFVSSNEYGLDVYLSVGIRHGTLSGQLRSVFESEKLVTELTASGVYADNQHWLENIDQDIGLTKLNVILSDFSLFVDSSIAKLRNSWIQIRTEEKRGDGLFDFVVTSEDIYSVYQKLTSDMPLSEACDVIIDDLWGKTEKSLANIRNVLAGSFLTSFTQKIDASLADVTAALGIDRSLPIRNAFVSARTKLQNTIDDISSWFTRESKVSMPSFRLDYAVDVALEMVKRCYPSRSLRLSKSIPDIQLPGGILSGMVSVMFFAFDNIMRHCGSNKNNPEASIHCETTERELRISISNNLYGIEDANLPRERLAQLLREIQQATMPDKVRREGGTGLLKMAKTIRIDLHSQLEMSFGFSDTKSFDLELRIKGGRIKK